MSRLGADTITVYVDTPTGETDKLGVAVTESNPVDQTGCSVQRRSTDETQSNVDRTVTLRTVFAPPTAAMLALNTTDHVGYAGDAYNIDGDVDRETDLTTGRVEFVQFVIRRAAG